MAGTQIVTDYTSGLGGLGLPGVTVVAPEPEKQRFGDPAGRAAYLAAYLEAVKAGPTPVIALVGPYGYSPAQTAASGARNDVGREQIHPDAVSVHNAGRAFLGLGAVAASIALSGVEPAAAAKWLEDGATAASMWIVCRTEALSGLGSEYAVETPDGFPDDEYALLRVRLSSRVVAGFETVEDAFADARRRAGKAAAVVVVAAGGLGLGTSEVLRTFDAAHPIEAPLAEWLRAALGDCIAFGAAPLARE